VDEDKKLLAEVIARLLRNKKILAQAKERARKKALCLTSELEAEGEGVYAEMSDCLAASVGMEFSLMMWSTLGDIDAAIASHGYAEPSGSISQGVGGSL
jgi:hypothetical protein